jgi:hypothetical protein
MTSRCLKFAGLLLLLLVAPAMSWAQGVPYRTKIIYGPSDGPVPIPKITVCTSGADLTKLPCQGLATIYTDSTLTTMQANPFLGDKYGNIVFYASPGAEFVVSVTAPLSPGYSWIVDMTNVNALVTGNNIWSGSNVHSGSVAFTGVPPANFYVATVGNGGSDSADCLAATVGGGHGPCLTVQHTCLVALAYDAGGANLVVNIGTGSFAGVEVAGFMRGSPTAGFGNFLVLNGNGAANTTITQFASAGLDISTDTGLLMQVENLTVSVAANQVGLFSEGPGTNLSLGPGLTITGAASTSIGIQGEQLSYTATAGNITISGTFGTVLNFGGIAYFDNGHVITCSGLTQTTFLSITENSYAQFDGGSSFSGCGAVTGTPYNISFNSSVNNGGAALPGTSVGTVATGGRYSPVAAPTISGTSGLGTGGTASIASSSSSYGGVVTLSTGSGSTAATGTVSIAFNESATMRFGQYLPCTATLSNTGGASWTSQAVAAINAASVGNLTIAFSNNGTNLTTGTTYQIAWTCSGN